MSRYSIEEAGRPGDIRPRWRSVMHGLNAKYFGFHPGAFHSSWWWVARGEDGAVVGFAGAKDSGRGGLYLGLAGVVPEVRGRGLHRRFIDVRTELAKSLCFEYLWTYTDIDNYASANNFIRAGFTLDTSRDDEDRDTFIYFRKTVGKTQSS